MTESTRVHKLNELMEDYRKIDMLIHEKKSGRWPKMSLERLLTAHENLFMQIDFYMIEHDWAVEELKEELQLFTDYSK